MIRTPVTSRLRSSTILRQSKMTSSFPRPTQSPIRNPVRSSYPYPKRHFSDYKSLQHPSSNKPLVEGDLVSHAGLSKFMSRVYGHMALGVAGSLGVSLVLSAVDPIGCFLGGLIPSFAGVLGISYYKPTYKTITHDGENIHYAEDVPMRKISYASLVTGMGMVMAPLTGIVMEIDPMILPTSVGLAGAIFGACAWYSKRCKDTTMMQWRAPLTVGLFSLLGLQLAGLGTAMIMGPNAFTEMAHNFDIYGGIVLFTGMSIYDSYLARKMYLAGTPDHLGCATTTYLDFMNLLIRIMEAIAKSKKNQ